MANTARAFGIAIPLTAALICATHGRAESGGSNASRATAAPGAAVTTEATEDDAVELVRRVLEAIPRRTWTARAVLKIPGGFERRLSVAHKFLGGTDATLMEVEEPDNLRGTKYLFLERTDARDEQYVYLPALHRVVQVHEDVRQQPFLGSDFYVSDLIVPELTGYEFSFAGEEQALDRACRLVDSRPKEITHAPYSRIRMSIDATELLVVKTRFYDGDGELLKIWTVEKFEQHSGVSTPVQQRMSNVQHHTESTLDLLAVEYDVELADDLFSKSRLKR